MEIYPAEDAGHIAVALAHCFFNVPLAIWIREGFMSAVPREIDESARLDGYNAPRFFRKILLPMVDLTLTTWRSRSRAWYEISAARHGETFTDETPIICEWFRVLRTLKT